MLWFVAVLGWFLVLALLAALWCVVVGAVQRQQELERAVAMWKAAAESKTGFSYEVLASVMARYQITLAELRASRKDYGDVH